MKTFEIRIPTSFTDVKTMTRDVANRLSNWRIDHNEKVLARFYGDVLQIIGNNYREGDTAEEYRDRLLHKRGAKDLNTCFIKAQKALE